MLTLVRKCCGYVGWLDPFSPLALNYIVQKMTSRQPRTFTPDLSNSFDRAWCRKTSIRSVVTRPSQSHFILIAAFCLLLAGCSAEPLNYSENLLALHRAESESGEKLDWARPLIASLLEREFGSLDAPQLPKAIAAGDKYLGLIDMDNVERSAGPVRRIEVEDKKVEYGLFRKHCAVCHGASGDGYGSTASLLSPYPRDFRRGTFKFGNQGQAKPPSHADLVRVIVEGIPGTAMPAMRALDQDAYFRDDCEALASYVQFLSMRGEVERRLWLEVVPELETTEFGELHKQVSNGIVPDELNDQVQLLITEVADRWHEVVKGQTPTTNYRLAYRWPEDLSSEKKTGMLESARRGAILFRSEVTACVQCHGEKADGEGRFADFDEWTKDWTIRAGIDPRDPTEWKPLKSLGLLKPVLAKPRNLRLGVFRGGSDPALIYDRIANGIDGTPMPAVAKAGSSPVGLSEDQIWDLVNYCQALAHVAEEELKP